MHTNRVDLDWDFTVEDGEGLDLDDLFLSPFFQAWKESADQWRTGSEDVIAVVRPPADRGGPAVARPADSLGECLVFPDRGRAVDAAPRSAGYWQPTLPMPDSRVG